MAGSSTGERMTRLYASCAAHGPATPSSDAMRPASSISVAGQLSTPHARSFPDLMRSLTSRTTCSTVRPSGGRSV